MGIHSINVRDKGHVVVDDFPVEEERLNIGVSDRTMDRVTFESWSQMSSFSSLPVEVFLKIFRSERFSLSSRLGR